MRSLEDPIRGSEAVFLKLFPGALEDSGFSRTSAFLVHGVYFAAKYWQKSLQVL